jgi:hypothetical protein
VFNSLAAASLRERGDASSKRPWDDSHPLPVESCMVPPATTTEHGAKERVREFWEVEACDSIDAKAPQGAREYFDQVELRRYELEPFIPEYVAFNLRARSVRSRSVLASAPTSSASHAQAQSSPEWTSRCMRWSSFAAASSSRGSRGDVRDRKLRSIFGGLEDLRVEHVPTIYDEKFAGPLARLVPRFGWFVVVRGRTASEPIP